MNTHADLHVSSKIAFQKGCSAVKFSALPAVGQFAGACAAGRAVARRRLILSALSAETADATIRTDPSPRFQPVSLSMSLPAKHCVVDRKTTSRNLNWLAGNEEPVAAMIGDGKHGIRAVVPRSEAKSQQPKVKGKTQRIFSGVKNQGPVTMTNLASPRAAPPKISQVELTR